MAKVKKEITLFCVIDGKAIPPERATNRAVTCSPACKSILQKWRRAQTDLRKCRICNKPSTPEERKDYKKWRRSQPDYKAPKLGRPKGEA